MSENTLNTEVVTQGFQNIVSYDITPDGSVAPVYLIPLTEQEELEKQSQMAQAAAQVQLEQNKAEAKISGVAKLVSLGLTEEEARAVIGL